MIIRAIASEVIDPNRVQYKDYQGFCNINLDGKIEKNRICELHFNDTQNLRLHIKGNMISLLSVSDIYKQKEEICTAAPQTDTSLKERGEGGAE